MADEPQGAPREEHQGAVHFVFAPGGRPSRNKLGFYILSLVLFIVFAIIFQLIAGVLLSFWSMSNHELYDALVKSAANDPKIPWRWLFLLLAVSFACYWLAISLSVLLVHERPTLTLLTDRKKFNWLRMFLGLLLYVVLLVGPGLLGSADLKPNFDPRTFVELLLISLVVLGIQSSAEELIFRGYLTQFFASVFQSQWVIVIVPSLIFAALHIGNPELAANIGVMGFYFGFGVFMSLIVLRERGLELAIGAHIANNLINSVLVRSSDSVFQTPAIFVLPPPDQQEPIVAAGGGLFVPALFWLLTSIIFKRRDQPTKA